MQKKEQTRVGSLKFNLKAIMNLSIKYFTRLIKITLLLIIISIVVFGQDNNESDSGLAVALATNSGNVIRILNNSNLDEFSSTLQNTRKFIIMGTERIKGDESLKKIGEIERPRSFEQFSKYLSSDDYKEFKELAGLRTDAEVTSFLNNADNINLVGFFTELKIDFMYAFGLGFLDKNVEKGKLYQYEVYREDMIGQQELWGSCVIFAKVGNKELDRVKIQFQEITPSDSNMVFTWNVEIPFMEDMDFPDLEITKRPGILSTKKYTPETNYEQLLPYINRYLLTDVNTKFVPFYRINDQKEWVQASKVMAGIDSTTNQHYITYSVNCLPDDVVESFVIPEDYGLNQGEKSEVVFGVLANKSSVGFIYDVQARDSVNSIILTWDKLADKSYYTGIEVARSWGDKEPEVVASLPASATTYVDFQVFPAGRLFTYYVRPLFININGFEQEIPAMVMHSCTTFSKPAVPYNLQVKTDGDLVKLTWEGSKDPAFHSYHVLRGTSPDNFGLISPSVYENEFSDSLQYLSAKETYYYAVMAMNLSQDTSVYSNYVAYVPERKSDLISPPHLAYEIVNRTAYLSWDDVRLNDNFIAGYILQKRTQGNDYITLHNGLWESNQYIDQTFEPGQTSYYRVASVSIKGDTAAFSMEMTAGGPLPDIGLNPVTGVELANLSQSVRISWPRITSQPVVRYKIYRKLPTDPDFTFLKEVPGGNFETEDENVSKGNIYIYAVTAVISTNQESTVLEEKAIYRE